MAQPIGWQLALSPSHSWPTVSDMQPRFDYSEVAPGVVSIPQGRGNTIV
jgi:hypothetical protein